MREGKRKIGKKEEIYRKYEIQIDRVVDQKTRGRFHYQLRAAILYNFLDTSVDLLNFSTKVDEKECQIIFARKSCTPKC